MNTDARGRRLAGTLQAPSVRLLIVLLVDGVITAVSLWIALFLGFEGDVESPYNTLAPTYLAWLLAARIAASWIFRLHRWSFRLSGLSDGARVVMAGLFGTGLFVLTLYFLRVLLPPRSVIVLELCLSIAGMRAVRFAPRLGWMYWTELSRSRHGHVVRTLIIGGGAAGEMLFRDLQRSGEHLYRVVGFLDDKTERSIRLMKMLVPSYRPSGSPLPALRVEPPAGTLAFGQREAALGRATATRTSV